MSTNVGGMTLPEFMPGGWDVNQMSMKVNDIERLLASVDFTSTEIQCGKKFLTQRIRFTNGAMQKQTPQVYDIANMIQELIDAGDVAELPAGGDQYQVLQRDGSGNAVWDWVRAHA